MKNPLRGLRYALLDFHSARGNTGLKIAMLGIALIPLIYGALYLMAFYDPYGRLDTLPVAVVNEDASVTRSNGDEIHAGDDLEDKLRDSDALSWQFVDNLDAAQAGLEDGTYYGIVVVPEDFSADIASADSDAPQQAHLELIVNDANNYLSSILGASVMRVVTSETNYAIGENYYLQIFDSIDETGASLQTAADGAAELRDGVADARDGSQRLADGIATAGNGAGALESGISDARSGAGQLLAGTQQLAAGAQSAQSGASSLENGLGQLSEGSMQLQNGLQAAQSGSQSLADGLGQLSTGSTQLVNGLGSVAQGASNLDSGLEALESGSAQVAAGAQRLVSALDAKASSGELAQLSGGAQQVAGGLDQLAGGLSNLDGAAQQASGCAESVYTALSSLQPGEDGSYTISAVQMQAILQGAYGAEQYTAGVASGLSDASGSMSELVAGAHSVSDGVSQLTGSLGAGGALYDAASQLSAGARQVSQGAADAHAGSTSLVAGIGQVQAGAGSLDQGISSAAAGAGGLATGVSSAYQGSAQLSAGISSAQSGAGELSGGLARLSGGLSSGVSGTRQLSNGMDALLAGADSLVSGMAQLQSGSSELADGLGKAEGGAGELADGLADGVDDVQEAVEGSDVRATMMSEPVALEETHFTTVDNYGSGFAPYFIALGLWVGSLVMTFIFKPFNERLIMGGANPVVAAFAGLAPWLILGTVQAILLAATIQFACKISVAHALPYYLITILASYVFCAIIQAIIAIFDFPGKFLAVVLLMLQLTTAAGTFPIETEFKIFQIMSPYLPMTYVVRALRQAMAGADVSLIAPSVAALFAFLAGAFCLSCLVARRKRLVTMMDLHPLVDL